MSDLSMLVYNALDSAITYECREGFWGELESTNNSGIYKFTEELLQPLTYFMTRGLLVDSERLKLESTRVAKEIEIKQEELNKRCGQELNPNSPAQCQSYFYGKLGIQPYTKLAKDAHGNKVQRITTDDKAMQRIARGTATRPPYYEAHLVQEIRGLIKLRGTYLEVTLDPDGRLRCSFNPRGTRFGRLSSSETIFGTGTNLQNLPETFKRFIIADPGKLLWEMDKRQAEWVATAYISGDARMMSVCESGKDPHASTASAMYKIPEDIIMAEAKAVGHLTDPEEIDNIRKDLPFMKNLNRLPPRNMSMRQAGKKSNHGLNYMEQYRMFSLTNEIPEAEARVLVDLYHSIYPGLEQWYSSVREKLSKDRTLTNCFGRNYKFLNRWDNDLIKSAVSFLPQSTVSDLVNSGIIKIYNENHPATEELEQLTQVHDSVLGQYTVPTTDEEFENLAQAMIICKDHLTPTMEYSGRQFEIGTDLKIGYVWDSMVEVPIVDDVDKMVDILRSKLSECTRTERLVNGVS